MMHSVHFVGFRGDEYFRAIKVFGPPTFIHITHDKRAVAEFMEEDTVVFGPKADPDHVCKYNGPEIIEDNNYE